MDKNNLAKFIFAAAEETFATMLGSEVTRESPNVLQPETELVGERVVALIGIAGHYNGTGIISCAPTLACRLSSQMMMADYQSVDSEVLDAMGEICNMVFGNVKTMLEDEVKVQLGLSIPTVVFGRNFCTRTTGEEWIAVPLQLNEHHLDLRMCLSHNPNGTKAGGTRQVTTMSV